MAYAPVEHGVGPTSAAPFGPSAGVRCDLPRNRAPYLGNYCELDHADVSLILKKLLLCND